MVIPSLHAGGMERVMSELAGSFCNNTGLEVYLVLYGKAPEIFYALPENLIVRKPDTKFNDSFRFFNTISRLLYLRKTIKNINPDSVLSFGEYWNSFVLLALSGLRYPVYVSDRCQPDKTLGKFHNGLRNFLYPKAAGVIAQTKKAAEIYLNLYRVKDIQVIGNPVREIKKDPDVDPQNIVLSVGRLIKSKNFDLLIKLFINAREPGWQLVIVGDDALKQQNRKYLDKLIEGFNAGEYVKLEGKQNNIDDYYRKSRIFAFTSESEGFPNVIAESLSAGLPVVAFDCIAGPSEIIEDNVNGFLIPLFDFDGFVEKLKLLMKDESVRQRLSSNALSSVEKFSTEKIAKLFCDFIIR